MASAPAKHLAKADQAEAELQAAPGSLPSHLAPLDYEQQARRATAALLEQQVARGHTLEQLAASGLPETLSAVFAAMMRAGIKPAELPPS